jgi:putative DNA primase/helicase
MPETRSTATGGGRHTQWLLASGDKAFEQGGEMSARDAGMSPPNIEFDTSIAEVPGEPRTVAGNIASPSITSGVALIAAHTVAFSIFPDVKAKEIIAESWTWGDLVLTAEDPVKTYKSKSACPLIKLATFGDKRTSLGCLRSDENMLTITGIEGDYDAGVVTPAEAAAMLERVGVEAVIYTTPSHTPAKPRWRVLAPLSQSYAPSERARFVALLNGALGGILASESFTASQTYYFGRVDGVDYKTHHVKGMYIDDLDIILSPQYAMGTRDAKPAPTVDGNFDLDRMPVMGSVNDETISDLRSALKYIDNVDRTIWVDTLHALKDLGPPGYDLAKEYSQQGGYAFDEDEFERVWKSAMPKSIEYRWVFNRAAENGWQNPRKGAAPQDEDSYGTKVDYTDTGNANLLARLTESNLRWVPEKRSWILWNGSRWIDDIYGAEAHSAALRVARYYFDEAAKLETQETRDALDDKARKQLDKVIQTIKGWEKHCRNKRAIDAMLSTASKNPALQISASGLDCDPWLFGVQNGVVDLRTGVLRSAAREDFVTKRSPVRFNPEAKAPRFLQFIEEVTGASGTLANRPELARYLQLALGYSLTGSTEEHKMFLAIGGGANGKNVLLDTFQRVAGDYCCAIPAGALMSSARYDDAERASPIAASLAGVRAAVSSESKDGQKLDVALVKLHTGGGNMVARRMRENTFQFEITHKLWLMTNHRPSLDHLDDALRGRLHLIPFDRKWNRPGHPDPDPALPSGDKELMQKLKSEDEGILAWLVDGAVAYSIEGLAPPAEVVVMTKEYFLEEDVLGRWLEDFEHCDPKNGETVSNLFNSFQAWCGEEGQVGGQPGSTKAFSLELGKRGFKKLKGNDATRFGLRSQGHAASDFQPIVQSACDTVTT